MVESCFLSVDGVETHYLEAGHGTPLLLIHGGGSGADALGNWGALIPRYAADFHVIAVDIPGFGRSGKPDPETFDYGQASRNRHMAGFIEAIGLGPMHLIGNSMGGATALGVAMQRPELVNKLVLMGSAGLAISNPDPEVGAALGGYDFTIEAMYRIVRCLAGPRFGIDEAMVKYRHELTLPDDARRALAAIAAKHRTEGLAYPEEQVAAVKLSTLVVGGKLDRIAIPARQQRFLELLPNSWGVMVPHAGHWVMLEAPDEFLAVTRSFLTPGCFEAV